MKKKDRIKYLEEQVSHLNYELSIVKKLLQTNDNTIDYRFNNIKDRLDELCKAIEANRSCIA